MIISKLINNKKEAYLAICKKHKVLQLFAFGSSINQNFDEEKSDIDLLVEFDEKDPLEKGEKLISFWDEMEKFFNKKVDLLTDSSIKNPYMKRSIDKTKILIYDGRSEKVLV